ncbi:RCC1/BLIP-II [Earliella scabrosa]|nr:RCC1/BLIP-II [Earliella scabrosa]
MQASAEDVLLIESISSGPHHTIAHIRLFSRGGTSHTNVVGWGTSRHGQLGPLVTSPNRPAPFTTSPQLIPFTSTEGISSIALGNQHTVFLRTSGHVSGLGSNRKSQLSGLDALSDVEHIGCTWNGTYAAHRAGGVVAAGSNTHSQLGRGTHERQGALAPVRFPFDLLPGQVAGMACGSEHVLCIIDGAASASSSQANDSESREGGEREGATMRWEVWGWGWNEHGNLGLGHTEDVVVPTRLWPPPVPPLAEHADRTIALAPDADQKWGNAVKAWAGCGTSWILVER